jgi:endonuclease/exonuclease/phosphatase family metal-dependent hydrolase
MTELAACAEPDFLSFDELTALSTTAAPQGKLSERLHHLLSTPIVENAASAKGIQPHRPNEGTLGPIVRAAFWNIERGLNFELIQTGLGGPERFRRELDRTEAPAGQFAAAEPQLRKLQDTDIVILNEVDLGMKRTEYRDVARDLAAGLQMNYAYGVEFVEVDRLLDLGLEEVDAPDKSVEDRLREDLKIDRGRYRGLHGNAILSRYPIRRARILRLPDCYDWYGQEMQAIAKLEQGKRWAASTVFRERIAREVRQGGRMALIADLAVPGSPTGEVTVVSAHLENRCQPGCRQRQTDALLSALAEVANPVILAGDFNTSGGDATPTSVRNEIMKRVRDYRFWIEQAISFFTPASIPRFALLPVRYLHGYLDPTALHVPFVWKNSERGLFDRIGKFRFADGYAFDFRGETERTIGPRGRTLANSNQRGAKGFIPTYAFERDFGGLFGRFKLDWFFVKPSIRDPRRKGQAYRFAPHFASTMRELNESVAERISDHPPLTVDLPFDEPPASD